MSKIINTAGVYSEDDRIMVIINNGKVLKDQDPLEMIHMSTDEVLNIITSDPNNADKFVVFYAYRQEPFEQANALVELANMISENNFKNRIYNRIVCYSEYTFEELLELSKNNTDILQLLTSIDYLIDGPFDKEKLKLGKWIKSTNQRIIDTRFSLMHEKLETAYSIFGEENPNV